MTKRIESNMTADDNFAFAIGAKPEFHNADAVFAVGVNGSLVIGALHPETAEPMGAIGVSGRDLLERLRDSIDCALAEIKPKGWGSVQTSTMAN